MAESARGRASSHNNAGKGGEVGGGASSGHRSRTESTQGPSTRAAGKRNRAAVDAENENSNNSSAGNTSQDETVATPVAKQRRGLYGRVSGLVGRAVGLLTPGRPRRPAAAAVASPSNSVTEDDAEDGMEAAVDGGRRSDSLRGSLMAREARGRSSITPQSRSRVTMAGSDDDGNSNAAGGHREEDAVVYTNDGVSEGVDSTPQMSRRSSARASTSPFGRGSSGTVRDAAVGSAAVGPLAAGGNLASFSPGVLNSRHQFRNTRSKTRGAIAAAAAASQVQTHGAFREGLGVGSLRGSTVGDGLDSSPSPGRVRDAGARRRKVERAAVGDRQGAFASLNEGWGTGSLRPDHSSDVDLPFGSGAGLSDAPSNSFAMVQVPNNRLRQNEAGASAGAASSSAIIQSRYDAAAAAAAPRRRRSDENADEGDPPFTPTELKDLVRSLRFRRGLPPAAAMYLLSKLESRSAALVRQQILDEHRDLIAALQDPVGGAAEGGTAARESRRGGTMGDPRARSGARGGGVPLVAPVARRRVTPPGADLAPPAPLQSPVMLPPPPRGFFAGGGSAGRQRLFDHRPEMQREMPPPAPRGEDSVDLLTPARRRTLAEGRNGRERSFAQSTPGGDRVWKPAETANQGTPWAAKARPRARPGGRTVVVAETPGHGEGVGLTPGRQRSALNNGPDTPAAMARRIISVLDDAGSPRTPLRLTLPGLSPAPDSLALRSRRSAEDGPLPTRTLSVPHPTGGEDYGGDSLGAGASVTPARLPRSRWARRTDTQRRRERPRSSNPESGAADTEVASPAVMPQSRKRKPVDQDVASSSAGAGAAVYPETTDADGADGGGGSRGDGGDGARAKTRSAGDSMDETETSPPRNKRARTNSEALKEQKKGDGSAVNGKNSSLSLAPASRLPKADDDEGGGGRGQGAPPAVDAVGTRASARRNAANGDVKGKGRAGDAATPGNMRRSPLVTPGQQQGENLTEEERRLEARRRGRKARSPYVHGGERVDPNAGLPTSIRPAAVLGGLGGKAGADGGGRRESMIADATKTPSKYWTCRGCYVRNYDINAKECDMCRRQKNFGTPHHVNPRAVLPGGRTLYAVRQGLEAVGMATPGQGGSAAGGSVPVAAVGADGGSGAAAATVATPSGSTAEPLPAFQFGGPAQGGGAGSSSAPAATIPVVASTPAPAFKFGAGVAPSTLPAAAPAPATTAPNFLFGTGTGTAAGGPGSSSDPTPATAAREAVGTVSAVTPASTATTTAASAADVTASATPAPAAAFTFGAPVSTTVPAAAPPATTTPSPAAGDAGVNTAAPSNPTATSAASAAAAAPSFKFGASATPVAPKAAATATADASTAGPASTAGANPSFRFGAPSAPTASGTSTAAPATAPSTAPAFAFGAPAATTASTTSTTPAAPAFAFGASSTTAAIPTAGLAAKFTFGGAPAPAPAATTAPAQTPAATAASFAFGGTSAPAAAAGAAAGAAPAGAAQAVGTPAKAPVFGAPLAAAAPAAPVFAFGASAPAAATATTTAAAGAGIAGRLGPAPTPVGGGIVAPTPSAFPGFGGAGFGAAGGGSNKRAPSPAVGGFSLGAQAAPKRGPSPANPGFGTGTGFGGGGMRAAAPAAAPGAAAFSFGQPQQQPAAGAGGMFGVAGAAPQPIAQVPSAGFSFGGAAPGGTPAQAAGGFGAQAQPGQFGAVAPAQAAPTGFGVAAGGFGAGAPAAAAGPAFSLGAGTQPNPATRNRRIVKGVRRQKPRR